MDVFQACRAFSLSSLSLYMHMRARAHTHERTHIRKCTSTDMHMCINVSLSTNVVFSLTFSVCLSNYPNSLKHTHKKKTKTNTRARTSHFTEHRSAFLAKWRPEMGGARAPRDNKGHVKPRPTAPSCMSRTSSMEC